MGRWGAGLGICPHPLLFDGLSRPTARPLWRVGFHHPRPPQNSMGKAGGVSQMSKFASCTACPPHQSTMGKNKKGNVAVHFTLVNCHHLTRNHIKSGYLPHLKQGNDGSPF